VPSFCGQALIGLSCVLLHAVEDYESEGRGFDSLRAHHYYAASHKTFLSQWRAIPGTIPAARRRGGQCRTMPENAQRCRAKWQSRGKVVISGLQKEALLDAVGAPGNERASAERWDQDEAIASEVLQREATDGAYGVHCDLEAGSVRASALLRVVAGDHLRQVGQDRLDLNRRTSVDGHMGGTPAILASWCELDPRSPVSVHRHAFDVEHAHAEPCVLRQLQGGDDLFGVEVCGDAIRRKTMFLERGEVRLPGFGIKVTGPVRDPAIHQPAGDPLARAVRRGVHTLARNLEGDVSLEEPSVFDWPLLQYGAANEDDVPAHPHRREEGLGLG
jgi:hypothetical protein